MPRPPVYNSRVVKIDAATDGTEQRLPLEGKLAQRQLRLMRSKLKIIAISWYDAVTFDLIRSGFGRTTFPSRGRLFSVPSVTAPICAAQATLPGGRGMPPPLQNHAVSLSGSRKITPPQSRRCRDSSPYTPGAFGPVWGFTASPPRLWGSHTRSGRYGK